MKLEKGKGKQPLCLVIEGPNGAGKTTFAKEFLPRETVLVHFVNADLIAAGISPLKPELAALVAGRLFLEEIKRLSESRSSFAFESTLSGLGHVERLRQLRASGYRIEIIFLRLASDDMALARVASRVKHGGHNVPEADVRRRFKRGWENFQNTYRELADAWAVYDNSLANPVLVERSP